MFYFLQKLTKQVQQNLTETKQRLTQVLNEVEELKEENKDLKKRFEEITTRNLKLQQFQEKQPQLEDELKLIAIQLAKKNKAKCLPHKGISGIEGMENHTQLPCTKI